MQSYPFTSDKITYDEHGLPKYDRAVDSAFLRKVFAQYFSDGVFYSSANALQVVADTGMQVAVEPGSCHIQGAMGIEANRRTLVVQAAEEMDRIDTVVARLDLSLAVRSIDLYVVKGTAAESPQAPELTRDSTIWELGLANLFVAKNVTTISQQRITDTRLDTSRCGQVGATVQPPFDTEAFFSQLKAAIQAHQEDAEAQIEQLHNAIEAVKGDAAWMMKEHYDPAGLGKDITVQTYIHSKSGTVHEFTGTGANGRAKMTADVQAGDTFTVNGAPATAYMGAESAAAAMAGSAWNGRWVSFVVDGATLNFKGGGGKVTVSGLSAAAVKTGVTVTVKQGAKAVQTVTGTFTADANATAAQIFPGKTAYVKGAKLTGTATSDATATVHDIKQGTVAYVKGQRLVGALPPYGPQTITPTTRDQPFGPGVYLAGQINVKGDPNLVAGNIRQGVSIFGVAGALPVRAKPAILHAQSWASNSNFTELYPSDSFVKSQNNVWTCTKACRAQVVCIALSSGGHSTTSATAKGVVTTATVGDGGDYYSIVTNTQASQIFDFYPGDAVQVAHNCGYHTNTGIIVICPV